MSASAFVTYRTDGDRAARDEIFDVHLPLARRLASRYARASDAEDLAQVACIGLLKAIERFDPSRGHRFASFAVPTITGEIRRYLRDTSWSVHVPRRLRDLEPALRRTSDDLTQELRRQPRLAELAEGLGVDVETVIAVMAASGSRRSASLEALTSDPTGSPDWAVERFEELDEVGRAVAGLDERSCLALSLRFGQECSQREIGEVLGVSQVHVSRLLARALRAVRSELATTDDTRAA